MRASKHADGQASQKSCISAAPQTAQQTLLRVTALDHAGNAFQFHPRSCKRRLEEMTKGGAVQVHHSSMFNASKTL